MNAKATTTSPRPFHGIKCPECRKPARTMHTYRYPSGTQRRRQCPNGHRFTTMERIYHP